MNNFSDNIRNSETKNNLSTESYYDEEYRPQHHFSPISKWLNDPNGLIYFKGEYHMFYQFYPNGVKHGPMHWGHAISKDLVYWEHMPIALYPDELGFIFSGNAVVDWKNSSGLKTGGEETIIAFFTHSTKTDNCQSQSLAYSNDRGRTWTKYHANPVIANPGIKDFRDPFVFWNEQYERWNIIVTMGDKIAIYSSYDLLKWQFESEFGKEAGSHNGVWECPALVQLNIDGKENERKWLLMVSILDVSPSSGPSFQYFIGEFDGKTFRNENSKSTVLLTDYGKDFYAAIPWNGIPKEDGRTICIGWMNNWMYAEKIPTSTWRGAMTIPRELKLRDIDGVGTRLIQKPIKELQSLRADKMEWQDIIISSDGSNFLSNIKGNVIELIAEFQIDDRNIDRFGFRLRKSQDRCVEIGYEIKNSNVYIDRTCCGDISFHENFATVHNAPVNIQNVLKMHIFLDRSSVELFVNDGEVVITDQIFPDKESLDIDLFVSSGQIILKSLEVHKIKKIW